MTEYYAVTINFSAFGLRDLKKNETIATVRGKPGTYTIVGQNLEQLLFNQYNKKKESPQINLAVGEFLSKGMHCGCLQTKYFTGDRAVDFQYLIFAYQNHIFDDWSLFKIAVHYHEEGGAKIDKAAGFYAESIKLNSKNTDAIYNLALIRYTQNRFDEAKPLALLAAQQYINGDLKSDAYALLGSVELALGKKQAARKNFEESLKYKHWNPKSFISLLRLYEGAKSEREYLQLITSYIAIDYSNSYLFNQYIDYLQNKIIDPYDKKAIELLSKIKLKNKLAVGAYNFNLGRAFEALGEKRKALQRYNISLKSFSESTNPPAGAIDSLNQLIEDLRRK